MWLGEKLSKNYPEFFFFFFFYKMRGLEAFMVKR